MRLGSPDVAGPGHRLTRSLPWKPALHAFDIAFGGRLSVGGRREASFGTRRDVRVLFEEGADILDGVADGAATDTEQVGQVLLDAVTDSGANVFSAHVVEKFGEETASFTPEQVSVRDFRWMKKCDVFVPVLPVQQEDGLLRRTDGTHIELGWATALGRPVVLITKQPVVESASHLLKGLHRVGFVQHIDFDEFTEKPSLLVDAVLTATERQREAIGASLVA